ncbi:MAG: hypothetical protein JEZ14_23655 [Marinilabiliaceae bacterium]|nr:hypothetical protein [Marinilabiliaceae bacterium]
MSKVFQEMRCAFVSGQSELNDLTKTGSFTGDFLTNKYLTINLNKAPVKLGKISPTIENKVIKGRGEEYNIDVLVLNFGGLKVEASKKNSDGTDTNLDALQNYLFPSNISDVNMAFSEVIKKINGKTEFTSEDIELIRTIANCEGQLFSTETRYLIIKKILDYSGSESYEDLVLDLIEKHGNNTKKFADEFLGLLAKDSQLTRSLFQKMNNSTMFWGKEDNFDRFLQTIQILWEESKFADPNQHNYVEYAFSGAISPRSFLYDGSYWFPSISYTTSFRDNKIWFNSEFSSEGVTKYGSLQYDFFQPVYIINSTNDGLMSLNKPIPAIYMAGVIENDNLDHTIKTIGLVTDVALTFTGIGNLSKLRHLAKLQKGVRIFIAGLELTSSGLDIVLNYTDVCPQKDEFCKSLKEYNNYIQLGLVVKEAGSALFRQRFRAVKEKAASEYASNKTKLIEKYSDDEIKKLDEHFGYAIIKTGTLDDLLARLNSQKLKDAFKTDFANFDDASKKAFFDKPELVESWKKLSDFSPVIRRNPDNLNQRRLIDEFTDGIASSTNARKGNFGEIGADLDLNTKGYKSLQPRITNIDEAGHNGLDGVYQKDGQYFIVEGKYTGSASLNPANDATGLARQMSDDWIATRDWSNVNLEQSAIDELLDTGNYQRVLAKVAPDGSVSYKLIDADGYVITGNAGIFKP